MQKIILLCVTGLLLILFTYFFFRPMHITNYPPKEGPIVAFGDSLVEGVGAGESENFVSLLSLKIGEPIVNMGVSGNTTRDGLARIEKVIALKPRIVIVLLGGNDALRRIPQEETFQNLRSIIARLQGEGSVVVLLGIRGGIIIDGYDTQFKALAEETGSVYVEDVLSGIFGKNELMADRLHPNKEGYKIIADRVYEEMIDIVE